jgi:hypothetical protein
LVENPEEKEALKNLRVDWRTIIKWMLKMQGKSVDWIHLAPRRKIWRADVNRVMNIAGP